jgi:hypothetical protein
MHGKIYVEKRWGTISKAFSFKKNYPLFLIYSEWETCSSFKNSQHHTEVPLTVDVTDSLTVLQQVFQYRYPAKIILHRIQKQAMDSSTILKKQCKYLLSTLVS